MGKYDSQQANAYDTILKKGQMMTLYRIGLDEVYNPVAPSTADAIVEDQTAGAGVVLPASNGTIEAFDDRILSNPTALQSFRFIILSGFGLEFEPQGQDLLATNEGVYRILGATRLDPSGEGAIIWNLGCTLDVQAEVI